MQYVFISHSHVDSVFAERIYNALTRRGFEAWLDKYFVSPGTQWDVTISEAIAVSRLFLFVISPDSIENECIARKELVVAGDCGIPVLPIYYRSCHWRRKVLLISDLHCLDHVNLFKAGKGPNGLSERNELVDFDKLVEALCKEIPIVSRPSDALSVANGQNTSPTQFLSAAERWVDLGIYENALNRLKLAEDLYPENQELLGEILYLREQIKALLSRSVTRPSEIDDAHEDLTKYAEKGSTDVLGIVKLAISQERQGEHAQAIRNLWRAYKMEPRIKSKVWTSQYLHLTDEDNHWLEAVIVDLPVSGSLDLE